MKIDITETSGRFRLDADRLARFSFEPGDEVFGLDPWHEGGPAAAVASRFADALAAGAVLAPPGVEPALYPIGRGSLVLGIREHHLPEGAGWPLRQVATLPFEVEEVACPADETFAECCAAIRELLRRAEALLPGLAAMAGTEAT
jgi:hypothetical protein